MNWHKNRVNFFAIIFIGLFASYFYYLSQLDVHSSNKLLIKKSKAFKSSLSCFEEEIETPDLPKCPVQEGNYLLPRNYPPSAVFVGYSQDSGHEDLLKKLIHVVKAFQPPIKLNILVAREEISISRKTLSLLQKEPYKNFVNILPMPANETLWAQDYMEVGYDISKEESFFLDLPYIEREGENVPSALALYCKNELVDQVDEFLTATPGNGDYGGNIEAYPGGLIVIGNNMTLETQKQLQQLFPQQKTLSIKLDWLETGHVDEAISYLPQANNNNLCEHVVAYSSPKLAIKVLNETKSWNTIIPSYENSIFATEEEGERVDFMPCFLNPEMDKMSPICKELLKANQVYEEIIKKDVDHLVAEMNQSLKCPQIKVVPFPQLFAPSHIESSYGGEKDLARAINPNGINNILLENHIFISKQPNFYFQKIIDSTLQELELWGHYVNGDLVHHLYGGIHCTTLVSRTCKTPN